jgi:hypothetical protein
MANVLQFVLSNATPGQDAEYNRWYEDEHLPHGVLTPGILAGQRFKRIAAPWPGGKHDYLTIWEIDDPALALEELAKAKGGSTMPLSDSIDMAGIQPPTMWRRASAWNAARIPADTRQRPSVVVMLANAEEGQEAAFEAALTGGGLSALADRPGVWRADFLTLADEQIRGNARKYRYAVFFELYDEAQGLDSLGAALPGLPHLKPDGWFAPAFRPCGRRLTTAQARAEANALRPAHV